MAFITVLLITIGTVLVTSLGLFIITLKNMRSGSSTLNLLIAVKHHRKLIWTHLGILTLFIAFSFISFVAGHRYIYYFIIEAVLFGSGTLLALSKVNEQTTKHILTLTLSVILVMNVATVIGNNELFPVGADEPRDILVANSIKAGNNIDTVRLLLNRFNNYYLLIPALPLDISILSLVTNFETFRLSIITGLAVAVTFVFGIFMTLRKLTNNNVTAWIGAFIALSTPRLTFIDVIPQIISIAIVTSVFFLFTYYLKDRITVKHIGMLTFLFFGSVIYHATGSLAFILVLAAIVITLMFIPLFRNNRIYSLLLITSIISLGYWSYNEATLSSISSTSSIFLRTFTSTTESFAVPYLTGGSDIFAVAWGIPYAIAAAFILIYIIARVKRLDYFTEYRYTFAFSSAIVGLILPLVGFASFILSSEGGIERYITVVAYLALLFTSSVASSFILFRAKKQFSVIMLSLLIMGVMIGSQAPEFAPLENSSFEALRYSKDSTEVYPLFQHLTADSYLYHDNDVLPFDRLTSSTIEIEVPSSYKTTRHIIQNFTTNTLIIEDAIKSKETIFMIKSDRLKSTPLYPEINLISSGGRYSTFIIERG